MVGCRAFGRETRERLGGPMMARWVAVLGVRRRWWRAQVGEAVRTKE